MTFISEDFLLENATARHLYLRYAAPAPILDFHCHLSPADIAQDRRFHNLTEIWLEGDHYKWRAMRADGVAEKYCSGDAEPYAKFLAWARTVPRTLRNPLYHWTHLELVRHFGIEELLDETTADQVWRRANDLLTGEGMSAQAILKRFGVAALCTTDDPIDSLEFHLRMRESGNGPRVLPTFRPDAALRTVDPVLFNEWTDKLGGSSNVEILRLADFLDALGKRHDYFHEHGCRLSDHGLDRCYAEPGGERQTAGIFRKLRSGKALNSEESTKFASYLMLFFGRLDAQKGWVKQLHLGAQRNTNTRALREIGLDAGFDSIGSWPQGAPLIAYLDLLDRENSLPKMILFNVNPSDNYVLASTVGNFPQERVRGKIQFGSSWWFLDQKEGIEWQLNALSYCGLLSNFVGMVTDSRSFMSFPRHEYFRRILCNLLGKEVEAGLLPEDEEMIGGMVKDICLDNALHYLDLPVAGVDLRLPVQSAKPT
jgi:glucuronate isomerase